MSSNRGVQRWGVSIAIGAGIGAAVGAGSGAALVQAGGAPVYWLPLFAGIGTGLGSAVGTVWLLRAVRGKDEALS